LFVLNYSRGFDGNKALIDEIALLDYLFRDEATRTIGMYTENLTDAKHIIALGRNK
jgi:acyl-CoA synthetase (NDP forming)